MNRRTFLAALGVAPILAKLGLAQEPPSAPAPLTTPAKYTRLPPLEWPHLEVTLLNGTGSAIALGDVCAIGTDRVDDHGLFYRAIRPEWERGVPMFVLALERVPESESGRFLVQGSGFARVAASTP